MIWVHTQFVADEVAVAKASKDTILLWSAVAIALAASVSTGVGYEL